jgi:hypothetical protein
MTKKNLEHEIDLGRRGFLKIFGATAVGVAVTGPAVAKEVQKLLESETAREAVITESVERQFLEGTVGPEPVGLLKTPEEHLTLLKDPVRHLVMTYKHVFAKHIPGEMEDVRIPFTGDLFEVNVPESWAYISQLYLISDALPPHVTYRDNIPTVRLVRHKERVRGEKTLATLKHFSPYLRVEVGENCPTPHMAEALFDHKMQFSAAFGTGD